MTEEMLPLAQHQSKHTTKLLLIGDSGGGKTGSLASLASEGYSLWIIDTDNGIDVLKNILADSGSIYKKDSLSRVNYRTITSKMNVAGGQRFIPGKADVWQRAIELIHTLGNKLGTNDVLVIDSLTTLSTAAMQFQLAMNMRLGQTPHQSDWYHGQGLIEGLLQTLYDESVVCNVIVISHITFIGDEGGPTIGYPNTLGKALPPKVGRYFNTILQVKSEGMGSLRSQKIYTKTQSLVELKNPAPVSLQPVYPLTTGLAEIFKVLRTSPPETSGITPQQAKEPQQTQTLQLINQPNSLKYEPLQDQVKGK